MGEFVLGMYEDITDRSRSEKARKESEERFRALYENAPDVIYILAKDGTLLSLNPAFEEITGWSRAEWLGKPFVPLIHPEDLPRAVKTFQMASSGEIPPPYELRILSKSGKYLIGEFTSTPYIQGGEVVGELGIARNLSERKWGEQALQEVNEKLQAIIHSSPFAVIALDLDGNITIWNPAAERIYGWSEREVIGKPLPYIPQENYGEFHRMWDRVVKGEAFNDIEVRRQRKDGSPIDTSVSAAPLRDASGRIVGVMSAIADITGRKQAEASLRESERRLSTLISNLPGIAYRCRNDRDWTMEFISDGCLAMTGHAPEELIQNTKLSYNDLIHPEDRERVWNEVQTALEAGCPYQLSYRILTAQGQTKWVWEQGRGIFTKEGNLSALEGFITDVTERKRTEQERQATFGIIEGINRTANLDELLHLIHQSLRKVVYAENCFIALYNKRTDQFEFPYWVDQFDPPPDPIKVGKSRTTYVYRTGQPILMTDPVFQELQRKGEVEQVGTPCPVWVGVPLKTPQETIGVLVLQHYEDANAYTQEDLEFLVSVGNQIAIAIGRKRTEQEVLLQKTRFQSLFENSPVGIVMLDEKDRIIRVNHAFEFMFGFLNDEIREKSINEVLVPPDLRGEAEDLSQKTLGGLAVEKETLRRCKNGTQIPVHVFGVPLFSKEKQLGIFAMYVDLTESKHLADQLRQSQKMEAVGRLAGGIAHDFNNLLTAIMGYSQLALGQLGENSLERKNLKEVIKAGERATDLIHHLLAFSRKQILQLIVLNVNSVVSDMDKMLRPVIGEHIELITVLDPKLGCVKADPSQMNQVIMNLAVNSRDAMPLGGKLIIETSNIDLDESYVRQYDGMVAGSYVMLAVTDTGCGMDPETISRVFEPFFTTKEQGKGTGLGLSTVYGIVKQSGGYVWVYSELGKGTTFKVYFPRIEEQAEVSHKEHENAVPLNGTGTILIVEDEEGVRSMIHTTLQMNGYKLLEARNGIEALQLSMKHKGKINLLLTDMVMPQMNGRELAERLCALRPEMKVIYMSGYTDNAIVHSGVLNANVPFLQKPFTLDLLLRKVREELNEISH